MGHDHSHHNSEKNLKIAFFLNLGFTVLEFIGGLYVNSIAIISDAVHDLGDSLSLGTSWYLDQKSKKDADSKFSFGYRRFSLLGALINSVVLLGGSVYVIYEAIKRFAEPEHSDAQGMILFAIIGVAVNGYGAWKVSKGKSMNEKVVSLHLLEDVLGWVAVLIVAIVLYFYDNHYLDPALSLLITLYILYNVFKRLKDTLYVFLQGVPKDIDLNEIKNKIQDVKNVASLHHTHLWSQEGEHHVFTTHIKLENIDTFEQMLTAKQNVKDILEPYSFEHFTIETELDSETCKNEKSAVQQCSPEPSSRQVRIYTSWHSLTKKSKSKLKMIKRNLALILIIISSIIGILNVDFSNISEPKHYWSLILLSFVILASVILIYSTESKFKKNLNKTNS